MTIPIEHAGRIGHRQGDAIVLAEHRDRRLLIVAGLQSDEPSVHQIRDQVIDRRQQELANADVVDERAVLVDDIDDVERFAVLTMCPDVVEHVADRPMLLNRHVVRRHQPADRALGVPEQRHRDRPLLRGEQGQQLTRRSRGQFLEEHRAVVGRHVVEQGRNVFLSHRFEQSCLGVLCEVLEDGSGILPRKHPEHDDLVFETELGQERRNVAGVPIAHQIPQLRVVSGAKDWSELVGSPGGLTNRGEGLIALRAVQLLFHLSEGCSDDIVVVHVWADGLGRLEPDAMNEVEIAGRERRRMGAEMIGVGAAAAMMDDESDVERLGRSGLLPGVAEQSGLLVCRERRRLADVHVRRSKPQNRRDDGGEDVMSRDHEETHRAIVPLGQGRDLREHSPLSRCWRRVAEAVGADVDAEQPDSHDHHVPIWWCLERGGHMSERMRIADEHQRIARPNVHLVRATARRQAGCRTRHRLRRPLGAPSRGRPP